MSHPYGQQPYEGQGQPGPQQPGPQQPGPQQPGPQQQPYPGQGQPPSPYQGQAQGQGQTPYQQPYQNQGYGSMPPVHTSNEAKGFLGSLFDFSFNSFVTPKIVKLVYVVSTIAIGLGYLAIVVTGFSASPGLGILFLFGGAIGAIVYLAFIRMTLEFYYAVVRMSEDINRRLPKT